MAAVTSQCGIQQLSTPNLLDLDADNGPTEVVQNIAGLLVLLAFAVMAGLWIQPLVDAEAPPQSHPVSSVLTVPFLHSSAPRYGVTPHRVTGPTAEDRSEQRFAVSDASATVFGRAIDSSDSRSRDMNQDPIV